MITEDRISPEASPPVGPAAVDSDSPATAAEASDGRAPATRRLILFGAFDRHNFGDMLLAHCAAAARPDRMPVFAGLVGRDLTAFGGHRVRPLPDVVAAHRDEPAEFIHVGGELLTTTAWEAAVMLQSPAEADRAIAAHDGDPAAQRSWARELLGTRRRIPYVVAADELPAGWEVRFEPVGGTALDRLAADDREEVLHALRTAAAVSVRDRTTQAALARRAIPATFAPDPAAATARRFGNTIAQRAQHGEPALLSRRTPRWFAAQLAAEHGDDATLDVVAAALRRRFGHTDTAVVLFRAGLAPWHDDRDTLQRLAERIAAGPGVPRASLFESAHVFDLCALIAGAQGYFGTSLHGWIAAQSLGVPARCLVRGAGDKAAAYLDSWCAAPRAWRTIDEPDLLPESGAALNG